MIESEGLTESGDVVTCRKWPSLRPHKGKRRNLITLPKAA